jgi:hypothetical protein
MKTHHIEQKVLDDIDERGHSNFERVQEVGDEMMAQQREGSAFGERSC